MNRYLVLLVVGLALVGGVSGLSLTFQNPTDFSAQVSCSGCSWTQNASGGNSYISTPHLGWPTGVFSQTALSMTYSAITSSRDAVDVTLLDSAGGSLYQVVVVVPVPSRIEMKMIGGSAYIYANGVEMTHSGVLALNPSYVRWKNIDNMAGTTGSIDDAIWGDADSKYIFGMPENGYFLMKDTLNPANSGFFRVNTTVANGTPTLISSYQFTSTYGKANGTDETVCLEDYGGACYQTYSTGTTYAGKVYWNLTSFFASGAPYGLYDTTIRTQIPATAPYVVSDRIPYIGSGANIQFDKNSYAVGETAVATVVVSDAYYDLATYSYHVVIQDIYGTEVYDQPITFSISPHTGTASYNWLSTDTEGVYYGLIYAHRLSDGEELLMNYDTADLTSTLVVNGYVFNAENATVISGARVNVTQGVTTDSVLTATDGNYTSTSTFSANTPTTIVASMTGYETYQHVFTPLYAGSIQINITLMPNTPIHAGYAVGGLARTPPYNRSISSASIEIVNSTDYNITTTNSVGYYLQNNLTAAKQYNVSGSKTGFSNSSIYSVTTTENWTRQDVMMDGIYTLTLNIKDSSTYAAIPVCLITDSRGDNVTTSTGTATFSYNYTAIVIYVTSTGYTGRSISYVIDRDRTETIYLTAAGTLVNGTPLTYYSPWQVRIRIADFNGNPLPGTNVTASYVASTLPSTSTSWLINAFGINSDVANEMVNSGVAMAGQTDSNGGLSFTMFKSIMYSLAISNATAGISSTKTLYPSDQEYLIRVALPGQAAYNNTLSQMANTSLPVYQLNATAYNLSVIYHDTSGLTTNVQFQVKWRNGTFLWNQSLGNPGAGVVVGNYTILNPGIGKEVIWLFNATRSGT